MELPANLRQAVDAALAGVSIADLTARARVLSQRYRGEVRDGRLHIADEQLALAYVATRLPATYAAVHAALSAVTDLCPEFCPASLLDIGAGPGTVLWAASGVWPSLEAATLLEASPAIRELGDRLSVGNAVARVSWQAADLREELPEGQHDLVTLAYVLDELGPVERDRLISRLWSCTRSVLVIVEPGTPGGWQRILAARAQLIAAGAHLLAPCSHAQSCPIAAPDWCHFSARLPRSRIHRLAKEADVPWEDEKFIYLAAARGPSAQSAGRILAPPENASGRVRLRLCQPDGTASHRLVTRREGQVFRRARRSDWGDLFES